MSGIMVRRCIYIIMLLGLLYPLIAKIDLPPARMKAAEDFFELIDKFQVEPGKIVFVALDFGPNSKAENYPQAEVILEHLFRRRIPFILFSQYALAEPILKSIPNGVVERLSRENPSEQWVYGKDWINLGFRPGGGLYLQALAKSDDLVAFLDSDTDGAKLKDFPMLATVRDLRDIKLLIQFTGLVGVFGSYVQFFQRDGYRPPVLHGCTSITIPETYVYLDSGQLDGLLEGIAGVAWYSHLLTQQLPSRTADLASRINTPVGVGHLLIVALVVIGNIVDVAKRMRLARG